MIEYFRAITRRTLRDQYFIPLALASFITLAAHGSILLLVVRARELPIPLHYNVLFGIDAFGPWYMLFMPFVFGAVVLLISTIIELFTLYHPLRSIIVSSFCLLTQIVLFTASFFVLQNIVSTRV